MAKNFRFGRQVRRPSTVEIKHELRMMMLAQSIDALKRQATALKAAEGDAQSLDAA